MAANAKAEGDVMDLAATKPPIQVTSLDYARLSGVELDAVGVHVDLGNGLAAGGSDHREALHCSILRFGVSLSL